MPKNADTHSQNTAPAPPSVSAVATPVMLPVPTVAARDDAMARYALVPPLSSRRAKRKASGIALSCTNPVLRLKYSPASTISKTVGMPHTASLIALSIFIPFRFVSTPFVSFVFCMQKYPQEFQEQQYEKVSAKGCAACHYQPGAFSCHRRAYGAHEDLPCLL